MLTLVLLSKILSGMKNMKKLAIALLVVVLSGCAAVDNKSDSEIYQTAIDAVTRDSGKVKP